MVWLLLADVNWVNLNEAACMSMLERFEIEEWLRVDVEIKLAAGRDGG
jgi:hypothetical protein